jgi:signal transduction histidine kinase
LFDYNSKITRCETTQVLHGGENVVNAVLKFVSKTNIRIDAYVDYTRPSLAIEIEQLKKAFLDAKSRSVKLRYVTEITKDNIRYCKELMTIVDELYHLEGIKGNFYVSETEYIAPATSHEKGKPASQIIYSNVKEIVEHQQYIFDSFWSRAIPAEQRIREIEEGAMHPESKVLYGIENTMKIQQQIISNAKNMISACVDSTSPSRVIQIQPIKKMIEDAINKGIKYRYITEITKDNIEYCKELTKFIVARHLDGIKGNFAVTDSEYLATSTVQEAKPIPQVIYSNVKEIVEQHQYLFETLWNKAIPAEHKIMEIEEGIILGVTEVIQVPSKIQELFINVVKSAKEEVSLVLPTINAFYREERLGLIRLLREAALDRNITVRILTPTNDLINNKIRSINVLLDQVQKLDIRPIETVSRTMITTVTIVVVDRKESLVIEKIDDSKDNFLEAIGSATYSNSKPTVLSYLSVFESMWQQSELYTHVKEVNKQLEYANTQLLATEKTKEEFISMISHELKTPLVPLRGYAQMLLRPKIMGGAEVNERQRMAIEAMSRNIEKLQALVDDIMDVYKLDIGRLRFSMSYTDITKLINETISDQSPLTLNKKIDLEADIKVNGTVFCDPSRINQVLSNLIKNSIDFVPDNGSGKVIVRVEKDDSDINSNMTIFTVEDNGIGIDPEKADKLFQKFYQIDTGPTRKHAGTGLGLVICKGIIDAHGGKIWVDKTCGSGSGGAAIKFTLPQVGKHQRGERMMQT